jgi:parallel beta-helix repeat protein
MGKKVLYKAQIIMFIILSVFFIISTSCSESGGSPVNIASATTTLATIYYVNATNGKDSNNGTSEATAWKTIAKVNASSFNPGDQILFKRGEIWREQLIVPSSGSKGNPITFGAYGTGALPIISGADIIAGKWTLQGGASNIYYVSLTTQPNVVIFDSTLGSHVASASAITSPNQWFWGSNILYVYSKSDPATAYTRPGIQAGARNLAIMVGKSYITLKNLQTESSNQQDYGGNIFLNGSAHPGNLIVDGVDSRWSADSGIAINTTGFTSAGSVTVKSSTLHDNAHSGFAVVEDAGSTASTPSVIQYCTVYNNQIDGIAIGGNYWTVEHNTVRDNGTLANKGIGIHPYSPSSGSGFGRYNTIRYNLVYNQTGSEQDGAGIGIDQWCNYNKIYYNIVYNNYGPGIYLYDSSHSRVYNNTVYKSCTGRTSSGSIRLTATSDSYSTDTIIKNNNVVSTEKGDYAFLTDAHYVTNGVTLTNNNFYRTSGNWYWWSATRGKNLATFNALTGVSANISSDPLFVSPSTGDFHLKPGSLAIDGGADVGLTQDYDGNHVPNGSAPDIGAYENGNTISSPPQNLRVH